MNGKTHATAAVLVSSVFVATAIPQAVLSEFLLYGALPGYIGGILPDIDTPNSTASNKNIFSKLTGHALNRIFGHRGFIHSILCAIILSVFAWGIGTITSHPVLFALSFFIGFLSHLLLDCLNEKGVKLLYPIPIKFSIAKFHSDGVVNWVLSIIFSSCIIIFYAYQLGVL